MTMAGSDLAADRRRSVGDGREKSARDAAARLIVSTYNRTTGAVICGMLEAHGRTARWTSRAHAAGGGEDLARCDILLMEVASLQEIESISAWVGSEGPAVIAIVAAGRPDLRAACEKARLNGCLTAPIDPSNLMELTEAMSDRPHKPPEDDVEEISGNLAPGVIDMRALEDLAGLGGPEFVHDIVSQFIDDAAMILQGLQEAMKEGDASSFRDQAHALRSCAANVGASGVYAKCLALRGVQARELAEMGESHVNELQAEVFRAREALRDYASAPPRAGARA
jgi:two-component system, sensor histidine kinase RpfC